MSKFDDPPFPRGGTMGVTVTADQAHWEGREFWFENKDYSTTSPVDRAAGGAGTLVKVRIVRNSSGIALLPKRLARFKLANYGMQVDGYTTTTAEEGYPIDEFLPAAGVADKDLFYIVVEGPATCLTDLAASSANVFSAGSVLVALTAATSQCTTAGRVSINDLTGATQLLALQVQNRVGAAMSAKTTANTNADALVHVKKSW